MKYIFILLFFVSRTSFGQSFQKQLTQKNDTVMIKLLPNVYATYKAKEPVFSFAPKKTILRAFTDSYTLSFK